MNPNHAKQHLLEIKQVFDALNIKFWLWRGVLLGAVRDKKFIPWDDDIDLAVLAKNWNHRLRQRLEAKGFNCGEGIYPGRIHRARWGISVKKYRVRTDFCLQYYYPPNDVYVYLAPSPHDCKSITPAKLLRKEHFIKFLGEQFRIPDSVEEHLKTVYGKTWRTPMHRGARHGGPWRKHWKKISLERYTQYFKEHPKEEWLK